MAIELSTAGILLGYAIETVAGTKPSAFTQIKGAKSLPDMNPEPSTLETTPLEATEWKTYIDGLKDPGGALAVTFNMSNDLQTTWDDIVDKYKTAAEAGKKTWWEFYVPGLTKAFSSRVTRLRLALPVRRWTVFSRTRHISPRTETLAGTRQ